MANVIIWHGVNKVLRGPAERRDAIGDLPIFNNGNISVTCWQLTEDELAVINNDRRVFVAVLYGLTQPPMFVGTEDVVRGLMLDYGKVWRKK